MALFLPFDSSTADYTFETELEDLVVKFRCRWNATSAAWYIDIEGADFPLDIKGIKLVGGCNLLEPYAVLELGTMEVIDQEGAYADPTRDSLGDRHQVYYVTKDEL
jgi:hypothetical protein